MNVRLGSRELHHDRVAGAGGVELAVTTTGPPAATAPTVVLVHGYPDNADMWAPVMTHLADRVHVVAYSTRGAGESDAPRRTSAYRLPLLVEDLAAVADATCPDRPVHVVGHDWGSVQAWEAVTTTRMAGKIASFTSLSGPCLDHAGWWIRDRVRTSLASRGRGIRQLALQARDSWYVGAFHLPGAPLFWRLGGGRLVHRALVRLGELPAGSTPSPSLGREGANGVRLYRANFLRRIARPGERRTDVPVQLVVPDGDRFLTPTLLSDVERWAPNLVRRPVEGRHWLPRLAPADVAGWVAAFVDEVEAATTGGVDRSARTPGIDRVEGVRALHPAPTPAPTPPATGAGR